jgi:hypothetical protein
MPTGPREARPDDRLRIEPGIQGFPHVQLHICGSRQGAPRNDKAALQKALRIDVDLKLENDKAALQKALRIDVDLKLEVALCLGAGREPFA